MPYSTYRHNLCYRGAMDHPASQLAIYRHPVDPALVSYVSHDASTLPCGIRRNASHYLYLGASFPVDDPETWPEDLRSILQAPTAVYGLHQYTQHLHQAVAARLGHTDLEWNHWLDVRRVLMGRLIEPNIERQGEADHWLWTRFFKDRHPTINYAGAHDMLAVRLTWALYRVSPHDLLPPNKRPRQFLPDCPNNATYRACVNPQHYAVSWSRRDRKAEARRSDQRADRLLLRGEAEAYRVTHAEQDMLDVLRDEVARRGNFVAEPQPEPEPRPVYRLPDNVEVDKSDPDWWQQFPI
jgi:hypothetical protein